MHLPSRESENPLARSCPNGRRLLTTGGPGCPALPVAAMAGMRGCMPSWWRAIGRRLVVLRLLTKCIPCDRRSKKTKVRPPRRPKPRHAKRDLSTAPEVFRTRRGAAKRTRRNGRAMPRALARALSEPTARVPTGAPVQLISHPPSTPAIHLGSYAVELRISRRTAAQSVGRRLVGVNDKV